MLSYSQNHSTVQIWDLKDIKPQKNLHENLAKTPNIEEYSVENHIQPTFVNQIQSNTHQNGENKIAENIASQNIDRNHQLKNLREHRGFICSAKFSPLNPKQVIVSSEDHSVKVWNYMDSDHQGPPNKKKKKKQGHKKQKSGIENGKNGGEILSKENVKIES